MAILFPDTAGQATDGSFTHTEGGLTWIWNGSSWRSSGGTLDTYQLPTASTTVLGGVKVDGSTVTIDTNGVITVSYTHLRAHETKANLVCRLLLEKKK